MFSVIGIEIADSSAKAARRDWVYSMEGHPTRRIFGKRIGLGYGRQRKASFEAVANALMRRDYSPDGQGTPLMVGLYPDRLEVSNPGGLFGALTVDRLGTRGGTASRNRHLARILEDVLYVGYDGNPGRVVENRGSGYPTINRALEKALMGKPIVRSTLDEFDITFQHRRMTEEEGHDYSKGNVEEAILGYFAGHKSANTAEVARGGHVHEDHRALHKQARRGGDARGDRDQEQPKEALPAGLTRLGTWERAHFPSSQVTFLSRICPQLAELPGEAQHSADKNRPALWTREIILDDCK